MSLYCTNVDCGCSTLVQIELFGTDTRSPTPPLVTIDPGASSEVVWGYTNHYTPTIRLEIDIELYLAQEGYIVHLNSER